MAILVRYYICPVDVTVKTVDTPKPLTMRRSRADAVLLAAVKDGTLTTPILHPRSGRPMGVWAHTSVIDKTTDWCLTMVRGPAAVHALLEAESDIFTLPGRVTGNERKIDDVWAQLGDTFGSLPGNIRARVRNFFNARGLGSIDNSETLEELWARVADTVKPGAKLRELRLRMDD
jgi:hypothetical protein